ncbi:MAG TPA: four helix bundle protein [Candidatus Magasanikbacteria bacterium]|nr:four helix bundle protein [Candidatus Magasanikbacteria bacterium]
MEGLVKQKIRSFTDLLAWKAGHKLVIDVYKVTEKFPSKEVFGLTNQIRRCVVSITSNIAEGFSRGSNKDKSNFYNVALGSLTELQNQILIAKDVKYITKQEFDILAEQAIQVSKLIHGLKKFNYIKN